MPRNVSSPSMGQAPWSDQTWSLISRASSPAAPKTPGALAMWFPAVESMACGAAKTTGMCWFLQLIQAARKGLFNAIAEKGIQIRPAQRPDVAQIADTIAG